MTQALRTDWLLLPVHDWQQTQTALHLRAQIVGKTRLALAPMQNHWWQVAQYVTARGLSTSPMPYGDRTLEIEFDFIDHALVFRTGDGEIRSLPLVPQSIAEFYHDYQALLRSLEIDVHIWPVPQEMAETVRLTEDRGHATYDREAVERFFKVLLQVDRVLKTFRSRFLGKSSPSHFWWGGFDMACTRFSGRPAPTHPGGIPHLADFVTREAYSHECISGGWWPGTAGSPVDEPAFYAYAYPEPVGCAQAPIRPSGRAMTWRCANGSCPMRTSSRPRIRTRWRSSFSKRPTTSRPNSDRGTRVSSDRSRSKSRSRCGSTREAGQLRPDTINVKVAQCGHTF